MFSALAAFKSIRFSSFLTNRSNQSTISSRYFLEEDLDEDLFFFPDPDPEPEFEPEDFLLEELEEVDFRVEVSLKLNPVSA